ncbi:YegP family protein [Streptococcus sp. FT1-106]
MYFVIKKSIDGQYYFTIVGSNHETVATSETY